MDEYQDFKEDFNLKYSAEDFEAVDQLIQLTLESDDSLYKAVGKWAANVSIEKHDALNHSYHITLSKDESEDEEISLTFYTGIDVGCELVEYSFDGNSMLNTPKFERVLDDLSLDLSFYKTDFLKRDLR